MELSQISLALLIGKPNHLEEVIPLGRSVGVVVNRLARTRQHSWSNVILAQDQVRVVLTALEGDANGHLAQRAAGQREGAPRLCDPRMM